MLDQYYACAHPLALIRSLIRCLQLIDYPFPPSTHSIISSPSDGKRFCLMKLLVFNIVLIRELLEKLVFT